MKYLNFNMNFRMKDFAKRVKDIEVSLIRYMPVLASKVPDAVSLGQGIPSFELPEYIREKLIEALRSQKDINKYSLEPGMPILKEEVVKYLERTKGIKIDSEKEICITKGAIGGLGEGHIRLSFAGEEKEINEAFDRIEKYWQKLSI